MKKQRQNAYFTVEATMVVTITVCVIVLLIYLVFLQYNRCLMEQDMGALALKGCTILAEDKEELMQELKRQECKINRKKYLMWKESKTEIELIGGNIKTTGSGKLRIPFGNIYSGKDKNYWKVSVAYENQRIDPVSAIRLYRKLTGGK